MELSSIFVFQKEMSLTFHSKDISYSSKAIRENQQKSENLEERTDRHESRRLKLHNPKLNVK